MTDPTNEVSIDDFGPSFEWDGLVDERPTENVPAAALADLMAREKAAQAAEVKQTEEKPILRARPVEDPVAFVFPSRSGGSGHVVTVLAIGAEALSCTCEAMLSIGHRPKGCWAMQRARELLGFAPVE